MSIPRCSVSRKDILDVGYSIGQASRRFVFVR